MGPYAILGTVHQRPLGWTFENSIRSIHWSETVNAKLAARSQRLYHIFSDQDIEGGPSVVIVNETTARIHSPTGMRLAMRQRRRAAGSVARDHRRGSRQQVRRPHLSMVD